MVLGSLVEAEVASEAIERKDADRGCSGKEKGKDTQEGQALDTMLKYRGRY